MSETVSWGVCVRCKWWQIEPDATVEHQTVGLCIDKQLQPYELRIAGNGGCNRFAQGEPARAEGSSDKPPSAVPQR